MLRVILLSSCKFGIRARSLLRELMYFLNSSLPVSSLTAQQAAVLKGSNARVQAYAMIIILEFARTRRHSKWGVVPQLYHIAEAFSHSESDVTHIPAYPQQAPQAKHLETLSPPQNVQRPSRTPSNGWQTMPWRPFGDNYGIVYLHRNYISSAIAIWAVFFCLSYSACCAARSFRIHHRLPYITTKYDHGTSA